MKTSEMTPEQKQLLTDKLLRIAQIKKIDIIKMHRQVLVDVLNGEGHTRTMQETGKNLTKSGIGVTKVETYRSPANNIQAVRLNRQLQDDWDKLVTELTPQPDLLARLLYHQGAEHEPDFYGEKVDVFVNVLIEEYPPALSTGPFEEGPMPTPGAEFSSQWPELKGNAISPFERGRLQLKDHQDSRGYVQSREPNIAPHSPLPAAKKDCGSPPAMTKGNRAPISKYPAKNRTQPDLSGLSNSEDTNCQWDKDADETLQRIYNGKDDD